MADLTASDHKYIYLWNKYRPAILKLMVDAEQGSQEYKFSNHEFRDIDPKQKGGYSFTMEVYKGKAINNIKTSVVAKELLIILQQSAKASELTEEALYVFTMDKQFLLRIEKKEAPLED